MDIAQLEAFVHVAELGSFTRAATILDMTQPALSRLVRQLEVELRQNLLVVKTVTVRKQLEKSGVAIKIKVPVDEFVGVAVATTISEEGVLSSSIELVHGDPDLNYKVFEEVGNGNVVAEWQNWGKKLRLPLYIKAGDGSMMPYSQQVSGVALGPNVARRRLGHDIERRPRFLNRRQPGETNAN